MSITREQVTHIARLARLGGVGDGDADRYAEQLSRILALVAQMNTVNTDTVTPMAHPQDAALRMRDDTVTEHNHRDEYQNIAPSTAQGLYLVPRVIE